MADSPESFHCPHCDALVPINARVCRQCGATDDCGWNDTDESLTDDYSMDDSEYDDFVAREFPDHDPESQAGQNKAWLRLIILAIVISLILSYL